MLQILVKACEFWDPEKEEFVYTKEQKLTLEHSLVSLSKWESIYKKPFLTDDKKTRDELISYVKCMTITQNVDDLVYNAITNDQIDEIQKYIEDPMTATWFGEDKKGNGKPNRPSGRVMTSEVIYNWMVNARIPFIPCEKWHLNRLLTLIRVYNDTNNPKKMNRNEIARSNAALNKARREKLHSKG